MISLVFRLLRPHNYIKNVFIFLPLFFGGSINEISILYHALIAFIGFSVSSSAVYILNDIYDISYDKQHPIKRNRPIASGSISIRTSTTIAVFLLVSGIGIMLYVSQYAAFLLLAYLLINVLYSVKLKSIPIIDIYCIAVGFVIRLLIGSSATGVQLTMWIIVMTFLLAVFWALTKRRDDVLIYSTTGNSMREVAHLYNLKFVDGSIIMIAGVLIVVYILYTISPEVKERFDAEYLYLTSFFVILGILRYMYVTFVEEKSSDPIRVLFKDKFLQITVILWLLHFIWIIYYPQIMG